MLADAILSIRCANRAAHVRRVAELARRHPVRLVDRWLGEIEMLMENDSQVVPEPLVKEIAGFLGRVDPLLSRRLHRNRGHDAIKVLDMLFEAEEELLVRLAAHAQFHPTQSNSDGAIADFVTTAMPG